MVTGIYSQWVAGSLKVSMSCKSKTIQLQLGTDISIKHHELNEQHTQYDYVFTVSAQRKTE